MSKIADPSRAYVVIGGGDGYEAHIVPGDKLEDAYLALHFGAAINCPANEREDFLAALRDEDHWCHNWFHGPVSYHEDLEDAYIEVVLLTHAITWRPMTEKPPGNATAMIRMTEPEGAALMPGPVAWSIAHQRWISEDTAQPLKLNLPGATYHWAYERDIIGSPP